jgi:hypothetical protein
MFRSPSPVPGAIDLDLPFAEDSLILSDLSEESPAINGCNPQPVDVDHWEQFILAQIQTVLPPSSCGGRFCYDGRYRSER